MSQLKNFCTFIVKLQCFILCYSRRCSRVRLGLKSTVSQQRSKFSDQNKAKNPKLNITWSSSCRGWIINIKTKIVVFVRKVLAQECSTSLSRRKSGSIFNPYCEICKVSSSLHLYIENSCLLMYKSLKYRMLNFESSQFQVMQGISESQG